MTVVKIPGRLVDSIDLLNQIAPVCSLVGGPIVILAGGGKAADLVREWDRKLGLSEEDSHWLAIRAMSVQAELLGRRLGQKVVRAVSDIRLIQSCVLDVFDELTSDPSSLPVGWHVTSDSISAWIAKRLNADRLVLLKAVGDESTDIETATQAGWVDPYFQTAASGLRVEWCRCNFLTDRAPKTCIRAAVP